jgi:hypothetical protein
MREEMRRENERFRENMVRENEVWKASVERELREDVRRLVVEKFLADNKPSSSSETSSLHILERQITTQARASPSPFIPSAESSPAVSPVSPVSPVVGHTTPPAQIGESSIAGPSTMPPPLTPRLLGLSEEVPRAGPSTTLRTPRQHTTVPKPFILPRKPRIGSYYAAIVDTDGDDPEGSLLAHMIEVATFRPGFLFSHTGEPEPHRDCCAILYFATMGNVHDWMHDVNHAYRLDTQEIERLEQNSGELKRKRRFDAYVRICKVEAEDPWEIFEKRRS